MPTQIKHCPSCSSDQIVVAGNRLLCRPCNVVYEVTNTGAKVLNTNPLSDIEQRMSNAERALEVLQKAGKVGQDPPEDPDEAIIDEETKDMHKLPTEEEIDRDIEENSETEEDGFVSW